MPENMQAQSDAKGVQLEYTLLPLEYVESIVLRQWWPTARVTRRIDEAVIIEYEHVSAK